MMNTGEPQNPAANKGFLLISNRFLFGTILSASLEDE